MRDTASRPEPGGDAPPDGEDLRFCIYIRGDLPWQREYAGRVQARLAEAHARAAIETVDVLREPARAEADAVLATPTVARVSPEPPVRVMGGPPRAGADALDAALGALSPDEVDAGAGADASEAEVRGLLASLGAALLVVGRDRVIRYANAAAGLLLGRDAEALVGTPFAVPLSDRLRTVVELDVRGRARLRASIVATRVSWASEEAHAVILREVGDARADPSEDRHALALRASSDGVWDWDLASDAVAYSPRFAEILGVGVEDLGSTLDGWRRRIHADDAPRVESAIRAHRLGATRRLGIAHRVILPSGKARWVLASATSTSGPDGEPARIVGLLSDLTPLKELQAELRASRERFSLLAAHAQEVVLVLDAHAVIRFASPSAARLIGIPAEALVGSPLYAHLPPSSAHTLMRLHAGAMRGALPAWDDVEVLVGGTRSRASLWLAELAPPTSYGGRFVAVLTPHRAPRAQEAARDG